MGCRLSQPLPSSESAPSQLRNSNNPNNNSSNSNSSPTKNAPSAAAATTTTTTTTASQDDAVYRRLLQAQSPALSAAQRKHLLTPLLQLKGFRRSHARFVDAKTKQTPLHLLCQLLSVAFEEELPIQKLLQAMVATHPPALAVEDRDGNVPLHYALVDRRDEESKRESNGPLHYFAMLPTGEIWFHGAPATFQDIPPGTHVQGYFIAARSPSDTLIAPPPTDFADLIPKENHALLLEDDVSFARRINFQWRVLSVSKDTSKLRVEPVGSTSPDGPSGPLTLDFDLATRVWEKSALVSMDQVKVGGIVSINFGLGRLNAMYETLWA
jgi:hypothetical protein